MVDERLKKYEPFFGKWHISNELGEGAFGKVYEIFWDDGLGSRLKSALKFMHIPSEEALKNQIETQPNMEAVRSFFAGQVERVKDEIRILQKCRGHSNIVSYEDHLIAVSPGREGIGWDILIRMELLYPVSQYFARPDATQFDVMRMWLNITNALIYCEQQDIIHRDIKPTNILVSDTGMFKLSDFGAARRNLQGGDASTRIGTEQYMAPEVFKGLKYDRRADCYSLGCVVYFYLNYRRRPFMPPYPKVLEQREVDLADDKRIAGKEKIPRIPNVSRKVNDVLLKSLAYRPQDRYKSASELQRAVQTLMAEQNRDLRGRWLDPAREPAVFHKDREGLGKMPVVWITLAGILLVGGAVGLSVGVHMRDEGSKTKDDVRSFAITEKITEEFTAPEEEMKISTEKPPEETTQEPTEKPTEDMHAPAEQGQFVQDNEEESIQAAEAEFVQISESGSLKVYEEESVKGEEAASVSEEQTEKSTENLTEEPTEKQTEKPTEKPTEKTKEGSTEKSTEEPTEKTAEEAQEEETLRAAYVDATTPKARYLAVLDRPQEGEEIDDTFNILGKIMTSGEVEGFVLFADILQGDRVVGVHQIEASLISPVKESTLAGDALKHASEITAAGEYEVFDQWPTGNLPDGAYTMNLRAVDNDGSEDMVLAVGFSVNAGKAMSDEQVQALRGEITPQKQAQSGFTYASETGGYTLSVDAGADSEVRANAGQIILTGWLNAKEGTSAGPMVIVDGDENNPYTFERIEGEGGSARFLQVPRYLEGLGAPELQGKEICNDDLAGWILELNLPFLGEGAHELRLEFNMGPPDQDPEYAGLSSVKVEIDNSAPVSEGKAQAIADGWKGEFPQPVEPQS